MGKPLKDVNATCESCTWYNPSLEEREKNYD